jgi:hypothetical protein
VKDLQKAGAELTKDILSVSHDPHSLSFLNFATKTETSFQLALGRLGAKRFGLRLAHLRLLEEIHGGAASASICRFRKLTLVCLRFRLCAMAAALYTVAGILFEATSKLLLGTEKIRYSFLAILLQLELRPDQRIHNERAYHTTPDNIAIGRPGCPGGSVLAGCGEALSAGSGHCSRR